MFASFHVILYLQAHVNLGNTVDDDDDNDNGDDDDDDVS
jgi:hypothetical protein